MEQAEESAKSLHKAMKGIGNKIVKFNQLWK